MKMTKEEDEYAVCGPSSWYAFCISF